MRLLLLDGNSIANRAFYGVKLLSTKDGQYTNALVGFLNILQKLRDDVQPDGIAAAFDVHAPTFRHKEYADYKAGRKGMPEELRTQMPLIKELLTRMGCHVVEREGYEADDILGTLADAAAEQGAPCYIATGDRDSLQLVRDGVTVLLAGTKMGRPETTVYDVPAIREKYGLEPDQLIDLKALMGDASDHIPGVPGVGEKTALDLMHRFGSLDAIYDGLDTLDIRDSLRAKLRAGKESAQLSRWLGTICREVPVDREVAHYALAPVQKPELAALMARLEFFKLMEKWGLDALSAEPADPVGEGTSLPAGILSEGGEALPALLENVEKTKTLDGVALFTDGALTGFAAAFGGRAAVIPAETPGFGKLLDALCNPAVQKRTSDSKPLCAALLADGRRPQGIGMDTLLAGYLLNPLASDYSLSRLAQEYAVPVPPIESSEDSPAPSGTAAAEAAMLPAVADRLAAEVEEKGMGRLLREVEIPLAQVLADMETVGFEADAQGIAEFGAVLESRICDIQRAIYESVGYEFNLNSPKQLAKALFEDLGLPAKKKTKSGYSTNAEVLESLRDAHPAVSMLLDYRTLAKLKSTYCDGLLKVIGPEGRIHSSFNQTETRTGRISSTEPNLQNIPVRQELGRELRRFFRAREGWLLVDADYSQIELRVLAHMAQDETMIAAFNSDTDIHRVTASQVFDVPEEMVTPLMRSRAKAVNFGIVYGIGAHSLSQDIGVSYGEAKRYIDQYLSRYAGVAKFMDRMIETAKETGYAETLFGRRRPLPELRASNAVTRSFGERVARNMPIQGTAADIIKIAMVRVHDRLRRENLRSRLILQVHDELIVEAPEDEAERAARIVREEMEAAADLSVKLAVDANIGKTWYDAKG